MATEALSKRLDSGLRVLPSRGQFPRVRLIDLPRQGSSCSPRRSTVGGSHFSARASRSVVAENARRIGPVDHSRDGVFLFNYFVAENSAQNLAVWEYTAGWFQQETRLDNSTVLRPVQANGTDYTLINHCRWDSLWDVLPSLVFKRSFETCVLGHFDANDTAPMPILYRLA